ncbi:unnamed protein product [Lactuca virosa]|uniref:Phorbol-ester/DAG-type domain-containing protein n=1 Tax=Lactuca virosa TaxID=75947 RepID=A0AAU9N2F2_9ASTR|nr:unnamed protein product [Lactuca virosa]
MEAVLEVPKHRHPLKLIDLQLQYEDEDDEEGDNDDPITKKEGFGGVICGMCGEEIHMYHRYYYKCSSSCHFSLHKFCGDLPSSACGKEHKGMFYQCTICAGFTIHSDCAFLPEKLLIQERTYGDFYHTHLLTISYSFPLIDQQAKHWPRCRLCNEGFSSTEDLWTYKCDKCLYYAHLDCVRMPPYAGLAKTIKDYKDVDYPRLLHLPFLDETYSLPKHMFFQQSTTDHHKVDYLKHESHQHPLILVDQTLIINGQTSSSSSSWLLKCHDPMKKTQLLCNGCLRPIMSTMPFYTCANVNANANDDQIQIQIHGGCNNFALHEWCTRLPPIIENHPGHPQHTLHLMYSHVLPHFFGVFLCDVCGLVCNGFAYCCVKCEYYVDVTCGLIPREITHEAHLNQNHLLLIVQIEEKDTSCHMCLKNHYGSRLSFRCNTCNSFMHPECALLLPEIIRHKYDKKHPMHLSYLPIENHKSEYFCEICEEDLDPHASFYHCQDCALSVHSACAPLILRCETQTCVWYSWKNTYYFVNIKFGGILNTIVTHTLSPLLKVLCWMANVVYVVRDYNTN